MKAIKSEAQFKELIQKDQVIVLFTADWCPDCTFIEPFLPEIVESFPEYTFVSVDRDEFIDLVKEYNIFGIPSFLAFKKGEKVGEFISKDRKTKEEIFDFIKQLP